jgi:hypothetical protein
MATDSPNGIGTQSGKFVLNHSCSKMHKASTVCMDSSHFLYQHCLPHGLALIKWWPGSPNVIGTQSRYPSNSVRWWEPQSATDLTLAHTCCRELGHGYTSAVVSRGCSCHRHMLLPQPHSIWSSKCNKFSEWISIQFHEVMRALLYG